MTSKRKVNTSSMRTLVQQVDILSLRTLNIIAFLLTLMKENFVILNLSKPMYNLRHDWL